MTEKTKESVRFLTIGEERSCWYSRGGCTADVFRLTGLIILIRNDYINKGIKLGERVYRTIAHNLALFS